MRGGDGAAVTPTPPSTRARGWLRAGGNREPNLLSVEFVDALCNDVIALEAEVAVLKERPAHEAFAAHVMARLEQWDTDPESPTALAEEWLDRAPEALPRFVRPILRDLLDIIAESERALALLREAKATAEATDGPRRVDKLRAALAAASADLPDAGTEQPA